MAVFDGWMADIPQQFKDKERIGVLLHAFSRQLEEVYQVFGDLDGRTGLEGAEGVNLDRVGDMVGLTRKQAGILLGINSGDPVIADDRYRQFLKYKVLVNTNECTYYDLIHGMELLWDLQGIRYKEDGNYPATIIFQSNRIKLDDRDTIEFYPNLCIRPAGVGVMLRKIYEGWVKMAVNIDVRLIIRNDFYPRYNLPPAIHDGYFLMDGTYVMNGYLSDSIDFYPVMLEIQSGAKVESGTVPRLLMLTSAEHNPIRRESRVLFVSDAAKEIICGNRLGVASSTKVDAGTKSGTLIKGSIRQDINPENRLQVSAGAGNQATQESRMGLVGNVTVDEPSYNSHVTVEKALGYNDGEYYMDGTRCMDADIFEYEL